jgi:predicted dehydrogenase
MSSMRIMLALLLLLAAPPLPAQEVPAAKEYRVAYIGLRHHITWSHLDKIVKGESGPVKLVAIAETVPELVAEAKRRAAAVPVYDDYNKMLDEVKPDIVWTYVENNRHLEVMQACAPRKIHLVYQKPLASTYPDALAIRGLAQKHGIQVMVNYDMAFYPTTHAAKAKADSGEIGAVWRMHGRVGHGGPNSRDREIERFFVRWLTDPVQNGAGALVDFGTYAAAWAVWYKGRPETVYATSHRLRPEKFPKVEDTAAMVLSYKDGVGLFETSWDFPRFFQDLEVLGPTGSLYTEGSTEVALRKGREPEVKIEVPPLPPEMAGPLQYFTHCLRTGKPIEGMVALDLNVGVMEILEAAKMSIQTGKAVALPLPVR